jgi:hypothetical protein
MKNKTDKLTALQARALFQKETKPIKAGKKVQSGEEQMDLSEPDECKVLDCVTINSKAQYVEYNSKYIEVKYEGQTYHISARKVSK